MRLEIKSEVENKQMRRIRFERESAYERERERGRDPEKTWKTRENNFAPSDPFE